MDYKITLKEIPPHYYLDNWEIRRGLPNMLYFRGHLYTADKSILLKNNTYTECIKSIDNINRPLTTKNEIILLGNPSAEFANLVKDKLTIGPNMPNTELMKLSKPSIFCSYRLHPSILYHFSRSTKNDNLPAPFKEVEKMLIDEKNNRLAEEEKIFLNKIRSSNGPIGEWSYHNNVWYYKGVQAFFDKECETNTPILVDDDDLPSLDDDEHTLEDVPPINIIPEKITQTTEAPKQTKNSWFNLFW